eukprot:SAG31_NODE_1585_length_7821_cov_5.615903_2_plen_110_part_00
MDARGTEPPPPPRSRRRRAAYAYARHVPLAPAITPASTAARYIYMLRGGLDRIAWIRDDDIGRYYMYLVSDIRIDRSISRRARRARARPIHSIEVPRGCSSMQAPAARP